MRHPAHGPQPYRKPVASGFVVKPIAWSMAVASMFTIHTPRGHSRIVGERVVAF